MYSLLLPLACFDRSPAALERPPEWRRRALSPTATVRSGVTGVLRVRATALRRPPPMPHPQRWSLL